MLDREKTVDQYLYVDALIHQQTVSCVKPVILGRTTELDVFFVLKFRS